MLIETHKKLHLCLSRTVEKHEDALVILVSPL